MDRQEVTRRGFKIGEVDQYKNGIYASTTEFYDLKGGIYAIFTPDNRRYYNGEPYSYKCDTKSDWEQLTTAEIINNTGLSENDINSYLGREAAAK